MTLVRRAQHVCSGPRRERAGAGEARVARCDAITTSIRLENERPGPTAPGGNEHADGRKAHDGCVDIRRQGADALA
jgi:hypothetical protein